MAIVYTDQQIESLVQERKPLPADWKKLIQLRTKRGHQERHLNFTGDAGGEFRLILRQNTINRFDFSVILANQIPQSNRLFRLRRYNGRSHEHTNHIEGVTFYDYHIHLATARYQAVGAKEDTYAEPTDRYSDLESALKCLVEDANLVVPPQPQEALF